MCVVRTLPQKYNVAKGVYRGVKPYFSMFSSLMTSVQGFKKSSVQLSRTSRFISTCPMGKGPRKSPSN